MKLRVVPPWNMYMFMELMLEKEKGEASPVLAQLKGLWPVYIAVIVAVVLFVWITRKPAKEPKYL